ncbi:MAG: CUB domain-containing protein [Chitinophagales bacterium]|nr:CUB domain-containing protein [Chitinophagales bacterium]MDW8393349.1 CUB domain-containing protein [Chitinophagales bacterium]
MALGLHAQSYNMANSSVTTCGGTFYDSGGSGANYSDNANLTMTFTSSNGECLTFTFTSFHTQAGNDILTIYDGPNTSAPVIGNFSGTKSPGTIVSSTSSLTFKFVSNGSNNKSGWAATITCAPCGTIYLLNTPATHNTCDGLFYDAGGSSANYGPNLNVTQTFCSSLGNCAQFVFYNLDIGSGDTLWVYDGPNTASPLFTLYTNTTSTPPVFLSSTGCITFAFKSNAFGANAGWSAAIGCAPCPSPPGATANYLHPTIGLANSYIGGTMISTCSGTYTDNGGMSGNYANNVNSIYQTYCPAQINHCLRVQFHHVDLKSGDKLEVRNGPAMQSLPFGGGSNLVNGSCTNYQACVARGWGPYLSNDQSGCITFIFSSNFTTNGPGWVATFDCVPCASGPNGIDNNDCIRATPLCTSTTFSDASTGPGVVSDVNDPCLIAETFTNWYAFTVTNGGTLGFVIDPLSTGPGAPDDYDWALYGPNVSCSNLGNPIRCSTATTQGQNNNNGNAGNTGISTTYNQTYAGYCSISNNDTWEDACGNCWVNDLPVSTGQTYYLCISKWSSGGSGFNLNWILTNGASIDCPVLPVEVSTFTCETLPAQMLLRWTSESEFNNDHWIIERSADGEHFERIGTIKGKSFSTLPTHYVFSDPRPAVGINYYRLSQTDSDGTEQLVHTTSCVYQLPDEPVRLYAYDLTGRLLLSRHLSLQDVHSWLKSSPLPTGVYLMVLHYSNGRIEAFRYAQQTHER